jgi:hypothetical protein
MAGKGRDRTVYQNAERLWVNKRNDAGKASSLHQTQASAERSAKEMLRNQGGGELTTIGRNHLIRSKDTISPGRESSVRDTEH